MTNAVVDTYGVTHRAAQTIHQNAPTFGAWCAIHGWNDDIDLFWDVWLAYQLVRNPITCLWCSSMKGP